jgi:hypothetical protein
MQGRFLKQDPDEPNSKLIVGEIYKINARKKSFNIDGRWIVDLQLPDAYNWWVNENCVEILPPDGWETA